MADWATIAGHLVNLVKRTNTDIVGVLKTDSQVLEIVQQTFQTMMKNRESDGKQKLQVTCFAEEMPVQRAGLATVVCRLRPCGFYHANLEPLQVVPHHSAILPQYTARTIHSDHVNMTKFASREDNGYKQVSSELRRWAKGLKPST